MTHFLRSLSGFAGLLAFLLAAPTTSWAQGVRIGAAGAPDPKAALDISATGKGLLIPRMDSATRAQISAPPTGLMVFQTDGRTGFWYAAGGTWLFLPDKARASDNLGNHTAIQAVKLNGNSLSNNGTGGLRIDNAGQVGIGTPTPAAPLHVAGSPELPLGTYGPNVAGLATATASSQFNSSFTPGRVNDGDLSSGWAAALGQTLPQWVQLDFGAGPRMIGQYTVYLPPASYAAGTWQLQGSVDATTWTTLHTVSTLQPRGVVNTYSFANAIAYRYYRLLVLTPYSGSGSAVQVNEWGLMTEDRSPSGLALRVGPGATQLESGVAVRAFSADGTLAANADDAVPTQRAVKTYVDAQTAPGDNLGNHVATQPIGYSTNDADKLLLTAAYGVNGPKLAHSAGWGFDYYAGPSNQLVGTHRFLTGTTTGWRERMRVGADGNVGIGTAAPAYRLHVSGGDTRLAAAGGEQSLFGLDKIIGFNDLRFYTDDAGTTPRMVITSTGNVGIGTTIPRGRFDVDGPGNTYLVDDPNNGSTQSAFLPGHLYLAPYSGTSGTAYVQARVPNPTASTSIGLNLRTTNAGGVVDAVQITPAGDVTIPGQLNLGLTYVQQDFSLPGGNTVNLILTCPLGTQVLGGGGGHFDFNSAARDIVVNYSGPDPTAPQSQWRMILSNTSGSSRAVRAYCTCARLQ